MRFFTKRKQLCLILAAACETSVCEGQKLQSTSPSYQNTTSTTRSSIIDVALIATLITSSSTTPGIISSTRLTTIASTTSSTGLSISSSTQNYTSTITSAPAYPWGDQSIPLNTCSVTASGGQIQWTPCAIFAGTVQMSYFPESNGNLSYPATYWNADFGVTMTSPSIYMMVNTITGDNDCGPLGPTYSNKVVSMDLTDVSTLQPYADHTVTTRMGPPRQLTLSDLESNCLNTYSTFSTDGAYVNTHPVYGNYNRCHPRFVFPIELKRIGYPYWMHCGPYNYTYGVFDPPGAVPPVGGLLPTTAASSYTSTYASAAAASTTLPVQETTPPAPVSTSSPANAPPSQSSVGAANPPPPPPPPPPSSSPPAPPAVTPSIPTTTSATAIATVGSQTISAIPGSSGVVLPNGSTAKPGSVTTITDSNSHPVVVSVGTSGVFIGGTSSGDSATFFANPPSPTSPPPPPPSSQVIATIGGQPISAAPGDSKVVFNGQTITSGGNAVTLTGSHNVASLGASGLVVQNPGGGVTTFALPTTAPSPGRVLGTIDGLAVSASGASVVWVGTQAVTQGGPVATISGNDVVSLGPSGLQVMKPGGGVTTLSIPPQQTSSSVPLGSVIASFAGAGQKDTGTGSSSSSSASGAPTGAAQSAACNVRLGSEVAWLLLTFCMTLGWMAVQ